MIILSRLIDWEFLSIVSITFYHHHHHQSTIKTNHEETITVPALKAFDLPSSALTKTIRHRLPLSSSTINGRTYSSHLHISKRQPMIGESSSSPTDAKKTLHETPSDSTWFDVKSAYIAIAHQVYPDLVRQNENKNQG